jgi:transposase
VGSGGTLSKAGRRTVSNVIAAGTVTIASMATTINALRREDGESPAADFDMMTIHPDFRTFYRFRRRAPRRLSDRLSDSAQALETVVSSDPGAEKIHLVMDNLNIHGRKSLTDDFGEQTGGAISNRLTVHYTPKHGSWLNQAEIEISLFSRQCLGKRRIPTLSILRRESRAWNRQVNRHRVKINWKFTRQRARAKFGYKRNPFRR